MNTTRNKQKDSYHVKSEKARRYQHSCYSCTSTMIQHSITGEDAIPFTQTLLHTAHKLTSSADVTEMRNTGDHCLYISKIHCCKKSEGLKWIRWVRPRYFLSKVDFTRVILLTHDSLEISPNHILTALILCPQQRCWLLICTCNEYSQLQPKLVGTQVWTWG